MKKKSVERTLVLLKPDAQELGITELIVRELKGLGLRITRRREINLTPEILREHYRQHAGEPYFLGICEYMMRCSCVVLEVEGEDALRRVRELVGATDPAEADSASIRGRYGKQDGTFENVLHASSSEEEVVEEVARFFGDRNQH